MALRLALMLASALTLTLACGGTPPASEGSESSESTDGSENESESGGTFVMDGPDLPETCDPFAQDCPEAEKCVPYASSGGSWDANKCVPILGDHAAGESCTSAGIIEATDDCDGSGVCWNVSEIDGELVGICQPFCTGTADNPACPERWYCKLYGDGSRTICELTCDPIAQDCADGFGCYWSISEFLCALTTEDNAAGEPCGAINDCAPGLVCVDTDTLPSCAGSACCTRWCDLELGDPQCDAVPGTACVPFFEPGRAPIGQEHIGFCSVP